MLRGRYLLRGAAVSFRETTIDRVIGIEGGYSDHPGDSGGRTRYGVTEALARRHGYTGAVRELPLDTARAILATEFWEPLRLGDVASLGLLRTAEEMFEAAVNVGPGAPAKWLQGALNGLNRGGRLYPDLQVDGAVGRRTLDALRSLADADGRGRTDELLVTILNVRQGAHYLDLCARREKDEAFIRGWLRHRVMLRGEGA